ncbi:MAG: dTDP-4-dehydrorhamnose reductase [Eubacterium sp.]|nr:dTDP-4-dehydrorhamnose reductase [Eubacterium sp.]
MIFVTGVNGQLGHDVMNELSARGMEAVGSDITEKYGGAEDGSPVCTMPYEQLDITDGKAVSDLLGRLQPAAVIHCAAWTAVDAAEDPENLEKVRRINVDGTEYIAEICDDIGAKMLYLSTDYVFSGQGERPWEPDDPDYDPLNVYGQSKLDGELAVIGNLDRHFIVRIAWVFGKNGNNFIKTMLKLGKTHDELRVVNDQIGTPTYTYDLARLLVDMIQTEEYGYYHATNEGGYISWHEFAEEIFRQAGIGVTVHPVTTEEYGISKAARPFNSRLDKKKLVKSGFKPLPGWKDALHRYLIEIGEI